MTISAPIHLLSKSFINSEIRLNDSPHTIKTEKAYCLLLWRMHSSFGHVFSSLSFSLEPDSIQKLNLFLCALHSNAPIHFIRANQQKPATRRNIRSKNGYIYICVQSFDVCIGIFFPLISMFHQFSSPALLFSLPLSLLSNWLNEIWPWI